jgi:hypothetical protein
MLISRGVVALSALSITLRESLDLVALESAAASSPQGKKAAMNADNIMSLIIPNASLDKDMNKNGKITVLSTATFFYLLSFFFTFLYSLSFFWGKN